MHINPLLPLAKLNGHLHLLVDHRALRIPLPQFLVKPLNDLRQRPTNIISPQPILLRKGHRPLLPFESGCHCVRFDVEGLVEHCPVEPGVDHQDREVVGAREQQDYVGVPGVFAEAV
jgi:hypothetical protein